MSQPVPTFVVGGAARAGSTAVIESLRRHPDIFLTSPKEPHYLALGGTTPAFTGPDDAATINRLAVTDEASYLSLFAEGENHTAIGEGSVSTLYYHDVAGPRLHALNPEARIVLVLREPVARAFSSFQYLSNRGTEPESDFLTAVDRETTRIQAGWHHLWHYTSMSRYADSVRHLRGLFGPDQVGVWWYDDLSGDPVRTLTEIQAFVGVTPLPPDQIASERVNASGSPRSALLQSTLQLVSRTPALRTAGKALVPFAVRERIRRGNLVVNEVTPQVRQRLAPLFADDLRSLQRELGRPVPPEWLSGSSG
ncbi:sulfotransferase family protein [Nocardioides mesophilus]|uniref:Sulfotransferase n=1 Tax=Nocardioides mesophilus TaxID=433659 RepID=A0A7G9REK8_9ACTN|nr:sulfotransferase [Nocardioides mesophilus]QNN54033.1 sulfotransferase [Nocardioides mesophilus]